MKIIGKILFFNADSGQGMIMTADKQKINFSVADWDDFDTMPSLGLEVRFRYEDSIASSIVSMSYVEEEPEEVAPTETPIDTPESIEKIPEEEPTEEEPEQIEEMVSQSEASLNEEVTADENADEEVLEEDTNEFEENPEEAMEELGTNEDLEDEIGDREESLTVTMNLPKAVSNYFNIINTNIEKRQAYKKAEGRLNYIVIRRFLWTTFNNLNEIDLHIVTPKIKALSDDLKAMASVYDDFVRKTKYPALAYEEVFLSCQAEYKKIRDGAEKTIQRINQLKGSEKHLGGVLKIRKEELSSEINTDEFEVMKEELKSLNGMYVDVVHMMAELDERYKHDIELLTEFEKEYKEDFYELFDIDAKKYQKDLIDILSAQAFTLDTELWNEAKSSKGLRAHFHKSGIKGEFNTVTYLKYYLDSHDSTKANAENKKLFELYSYLISLEKDQILIMLSDANDALEYEGSIKKTDKTYEVKAFIEEKAALKWAMKHSVKVLIIENELTKMRAATFLQYYKKYVLVIPKIILLGNSKDSDLYTIHKLLPRGISSRVVAQNVQELLADEKD